MKRLGFLLCLLSGCSDATPTTTTRELTPNPCDACSPHATCDEAGACLCNEGFSGDGQSCVDIDECLIALCEGETICENLPGSFQCTCPPGYEPDGTACVDVNECEGTTSPCAPNVTCTNSVGSYSCGACPIGFAGTGVYCDACDEGLGDGQSCAVDIDECEAGTASCGENAHCENTFGSFACVCDEPYFGDGFTCTHDVDECATDNGGCGDPAESGCLNTNEGFHCTRVFAGHWAGEDDGDDSGSTNDATVNGATYQDGLVGRAFHFNGAAQHLRVDDAPDFHPESLSVLGWVYFDSLDSDGATEPGKQVIASKRNSDAGSTFSLAKVRSGGSDYFRFTLEAPTSEGGEATSTTPLVEDTWYHVAGVFDATAHTLTLYVNGRSEASVAYEGALDHCDTHCVQAPLLVGSALHGAIDELRLYGRVLSRFELEESIVKSFGTPSLWLDATAASTLTLSGTDVTTWGDRSGNGNHATAVASPVMTPSSVLGSGTAIRFEGADVFDVPSAAVPAGTQYTVFVSFARLDGRTNGYFFTSGDSSCGSVNACWHLGNAHNTLTHLAHWGNDLGVTVPAYSTPTPTLYSGVLNATGKSLSLDTPSAHYGNSDTNTAFLTAGVGHLGKAIAQGVFYYGDIGELMIFHRALTPAQRDAVQSYMRAKWF